MKILFICKANVGRSQMAESIFSKLTKKHQTFSAGVSPGSWEGKKLSETEFVKVCLSEIGLDVNEKVSKKLTEEMVINADKIVTIVEEELWPGFLKESDKVIKWDIADPGDEDLEFHRMTMNKIEKLVISLIKSLP